MAKAILTAEGHGLLLLSLVATQMSLTQIIGRRHGSIAKKQQVIMLVLL